jgi:hypothetical protein
MIAWFLWRQESATGTLVPVSRPYAPSRNGMTAAESAGTTLMS